MPNLQNLEKGKNTQFKEGQSGNPKGRPPNSITSLLKELGKGEILQFKLVSKKPDGTIQETELDLRTKADESGNTKNINHVIAAQLLNMAVGGDLGAIKEVLNRTDGMVDNKPQGDAPTDDDKVIEW